MSVYTKPTDMRERERSERLAIDSPVHICVAVLFTHSSSSSSVRRKNINKSRANFERSKTRLLFMNFICLFIRYRLLRSEYLRQNQLVIILCCQQINEIPYNNVTFRFRFPRHTSAYRRCPFFLRNQKRKY